MKKKTVADNASKMTYEKRSVLKIRRKKKNVSRKSVKNVKSIDVSSTKKKGKELKRKINAVKRSRMKCVKEEILRTNVFVKLTSLNERNRTMKISVNALSKTSIEKDKMTKTNVNVSSRTSNESVERKKKTLKKDDVNRMLN